MSFEITPDLVSKINTLLNEGLVRGKGVPSPGNMCVEAAICYALDLDHSDDPQCVNYALRSYKINLNDAYWSTKTARGKGMKRLAILQLGTSEGFDEAYFAEQLVLRSINTVLALYLKERYFEEMAKHCRSITSIDNAYKFIDAFNRSFFTRPILYAYGTISSLKRGCYRSASGYCANLAEECHTCLVFKDTDKILLLSAKIAEDILISMNVPGVKYLDLLD